jgi:hypothetical protein
MVKSDKKSPVFTIILIFVLGVWAAVMGAYIARNRSTVRLPKVFSGFKESDTAEWDRDRWLGIYQGRNKIGYMFSRLRKVDDGYELWSKTRIKLSLLDKAQEINLDLQGRLDKDYSIRELNFEALSDFMEIKAQGVRDGNDFHVALNTGGERIEHTLHFENPPTMEMQWMVQELLAEAGPGDEFSFTIFEPMTQKDMEVIVKVVSDEEIKIGQRKIPCWKAEIILNDQAEYAWVSKETGEIVKEHHPGSGFTTILEGKEEALKMDWDKAGNVDVLVTLMVPSDNVLVEPRSVTYLKARLAGAPLDNLDLTLPGRQAVSGSTVEIVMEQAIPATGYALPIKGSLPDRAAEFSEWLEPTPFIQSDHKRIKEAAGEAVGEAGEAVAAVDGLLAWVSKNVEPSLVTSIPSALEVLGKKKGACKEHTVLFIAMARSLGIPARTVSGIVYSDQQMIEGFYYHAWAEVYLAGPDGAGSWVSVDPTFNQSPADATHVKLIEGDLEKMLNLMQVIGRLRVEVEDYR